MKIIKDVVIDYNEFLRTIGNVSLYIKDNKVINSLVENKLLPIKQYSMGKLNKITILDSVYVSILFKIRT